MDRNSISDSSSSCGESVPELGSKLSVVELQSELFPVQPRGGNSPDWEIRNAGVSAMSGSESLSSSGSTPPHGKLKEPRDLYSTTTLLHPLKWPVECQVIPEKIRHLDYSPSKLEPFYTPTGKEPMPQPVGIEMGTVVYDYQPKLSVDYFCRATVGGSQDLDDYGVTDQPGQDSATLKFESRFESGNLAKAIKVTNMYYELYLRPDLYTERHAQWFYFRIQNTRDNIQYRFSIVNFNKPDSLYRYGLKVLMYSEKEAQLNGIGWTRVGQNIAYFKNDISFDDNGPYYTLTFNLKFRHNNDTVYLAQCYPYTYSTLQSYLKSIEEDEFKSQLLTIRLLCRSLAGNNVHVLTVTSPPPSSTSSVSGDSGHISQNSSTDTEPLELNANKKPVIVISARVHPGESQSSYMMKGIIDFLTSNCSQAKELRDRFIFKLIPMLNPDGVIVGNSRCCLLGQDLNRQYRTVLREAFPQIYHTKVMLRRLQEENGLFLYCDLHGHSRKHNVFIYGCENRRVPEKKLVEQVFPLMMHKNAADKFSFQNCKFKIQKNKEGTGRIFVWTLGVANSYTLEISLGGSTMPSRQCTHFSTADYEACGRHFCETLLDYSDPTAIKETLRDRILQKLIDEGSTADEPKNVQLSDYSSLSNSETDGEGDDDSDTGVKLGASNNDNDKKTVLQVSNTNPRGNLKRQVSVRKQLPFQLRQKTAVKKIHVSSNDSRPPLPVHRASVDFTRVLLKQKKLEEPLVMQPPPGLEETEASQKESLKLEDFQMSPSFRRLTKFRRKSKKYGTVTSLENVSHGPNLPTAKCATILFDDPFKPPGRPGRQARRNGCYYENKNDALPFPSDGNGCNENLMDWLSGTEDECDPCDRPAPTIKITNCCGDSDEEANLEKEMRQMNLASSDTDSKHEATGFVPFTPSFPVGKALLQTCYPIDKEKVPSKTPQKMTSSLSDTTISTKSGLPNRRSSISSLTGGISPVNAHRNKLQATGSTIFGCHSPVDTSRRRVSWTGTLTVSIPSVPPSVLAFPRSPKPSPGQQKNKSFRKSRSLNDSTKDVEFSGESCVSTASSSSFSVDKIPGVVISMGPSAGILATANKGNPSKWTGSSKRLPASSSSIVAAVVSTATSSSGKFKKRGKLKRTKHK